MASGSRIRGPRIPPTAQDQLSVGLNWLDLISRGRLGRRLIAAAMLHQRRVGTEPGILIAAAVQYLAAGLDRHDDFLNQYWHIVNQVSARERARYLNLEEEDLL